VFQRNDAMSTLSRKMMDRIERARTQRMFLIRREKVSDCESKFAVLGSTGNVYDVVIDSTPRCTCPDNVNGYLCKHIVRF
jgi:hypothetical protein